MRKACGVGKVYIYLSKKSNNKNISVMTAQNHMLNNQEWSEGKNEAKASLEHFYSDEIAALQEKISVTLEDIKMFELYLDDTEGEYNRKHIESRVKYLRGVVVFNTAKQDFFESQKNNLK